MLSLKLMLAFVGWEKCGLRRRFLIESCPTTTCRASDSCRGLTRSNDYRVSHHSAPIRADIADLFFTIEVFSVARESGADQLDINIDN